MTIVNSRSGLWALAGLIAGGCATGPFAATGVFLPPRHHAALAKARVCCASYREMHYAALKSHVETAAVLAPDSPVYEFGAQRSFFAAYELPEGTGRVLQVRTKPVNTRWNLTAHVLIPAVTLLDGAHTVLKTLRPSFDTRLEFPTHAWAEAFIRVPDAARYAVLSASPEAEGLAWRDDTQASGWLFVRAGPTGEISVTSSRSQPVR
jgi:hypothetical protein